MNAQGSLLATGVPGLDTILGGGLSHGALVFLVGASGAGKTMLGSQILFNAAQGGAKALILTAFAEGNVKLLEHLRSLAFFDENLVGGPVTLLSLQSLLGDQPETAVATLVRTIRETGAQLVLIDGFHGAEDLLPGRIAVRSMLASLASQLTFLDVTLLVTLEGSARDPVLGVELATADVIIGLEYTVEGWRHMRRLEVVKQRGQRLLGGLHTYRLDVHGVTVFPRLEVLPPREAGPPLAERAAFGLPQLDQLLGGGLTAGTATLLAGAPGTGKTTLALHWALTAAGPDEATVFLSFRERPERLQQKADAFGLDLNATIETSALKLLWVPPVELNPDVVAGKLLDALARTNARRLVVDDLTSLLVELGSRAHDYLGALVQHLYSAGVTSLFTHEITPFEGFRLEMDNTPISAVSENVIVVQKREVAGRQHRLLAVVKMRFSDYDESLRELVLDPQGVRVLTVEESERGVLDVGDRG